MILGVCEKLEKKSGIDAWIFRMLFLIFGFSLAGIFFYIFLDLFID